MGCERAVTSRLSSILRLLTVNITEGAIHMQGSGNLCLAFFVINVLRLSLPGFKISVNTSSRVAVPLSCFKMVINKLETDATYKP